MTLFDPDPAEEPEEPGNDLSASYAGTVGFVKGSDTSQDAEESIRRSGRAAKVQQGVLAVLAEFPKGLITHEVQREVGNRVSVHESVSSALRNMEMAGRVFRLRERRRTEANQWAHPYVHPTFRDLYQPDEILPPTPRRINITDKIAADLRLVLEGWGIDDPSNPSFQAMLRVRALLDSMEPPM